MTLSTQAQSLILTTAVSLILIALLSRRTHLLSLSPFVASGDDFIIAMSSRAAQVLTLGFSSRLVLVDSKKKSIIIRSRSFWFYKKIRKIRFAQVRQILYGLTDLNPGTAMGLTGDSFEAYSVGIRLIDGEDIRLFRFIGDGTFRCGWEIPERLGGVYALQGLTDMSGTQEEDSRAFLDRLARLINVEIGRY